MKMIMGEIDAAINYCEIYIYIIPKCRQLNYTASRESLFSKLEGNGTFVFHIEVNPECNNEKNNYNNNNPRL